MRYPEEVLTSVVAFANPRKIAGAEVTVEGDHGVATLVKLLRDALWMNRTEVQVVRMGERKSLWILSDLMLIMTLDHAPVRFLRARLF